MSTQLTTFSGAKAVVWGNRIGITYGANNNTGFTLAQSATFTKDGDEQEIRDSSGEVQTFVTYNKRETLDIEVIPVGETLALAADHNISPAKGDIVVITDTSGNNSHDELAQSYICISSTQTNSNTAEVRISMSLRAYAAGIATAEVAGT